MQCQEWWKRSRLQSRSLRLNCRRQKVSVQYRYPPCVLIDGNLMLPPKPWAHEACWLCDEHPHPSKLSLYERPLKACLSSSSAKQSVVVEVDSMVGPLTFS